MSQAQTPLHRWTFDGQDPWTAAVGGQRLKPNDRTTSHRDGQQGYVQFVGGTALNLALLDAPSVLSIELLFRLRTDSYAHRGEIVAASDNSFRFYLWPQMIGYTAAFRVQGELKYEAVQISLRSTDRSSYGYYLDGAWHHLVILFDARIGKGAVWADGQLLGEATLPKGVAMGQNSQFWLGIGKDFVGDIGDISIYPNRLSPTEIERRYKQLVPQTRQAPAPVLPTETAAAIDPREYAPGHPQVQTSAIDQLRQFPAPRYKTGHTLRPLYNWMGMSHFGGETQPGVSRAQVVQHGVWIQEEMGLNWHYALAIQNSRFARTSDQLTGNAEELQAIVALANRYPDIPLSVTTLWAQIDHRVLGETGGDAYITRNNLDKRYYLHDARGNLLDGNGNPGNTAWISPAAPDDLIRRDGQAQAIYIRRLLDWLDRPIDYINENGEVEPGIYGEKVLEQDPDLRKHFQQSGDSWDIYQAKQKLRLRATYRNMFTRDIPELKNTVFSWYGVDAGTVGRWDWAVSRQIGDKIGGQYYSTPDFYPRWPDNWRAWKGAWRGWKWIEDCRRVEIPMGDRLYSPFIGAGWAIDPERNLRPSQWLGLLKMLPLTGAEFFYTGFFNETSGQGPHTFPRPENYAWQAVMPAYAQAITSYYEPVLREGNLLSDAQGLPIVTWPVNDPRVLVVVRKHDRLPVYVIGGTIQPESNIRGNVPDETVVQIELAGRKLTLTVRRQGSVYIYDVQDPARPVFYQLDAWHEAGHPAWWSRDVVFDAEVYEAAVSAAILTETGAPAGDYRAFRSFVRLERAGARLDYTLSPRPAQGATTYEVCVEARTRPGQRAVVEVWLGDKLLGSLRIQGDTWKEYHVGDWTTPVGTDALRNPAHRLQVRYREGQADIDRVLCRVKK
ncbi:MAG: hypothetical protein OHK0039_21170 [Bacteroidia bacterium]